MISAMLLQMAQFLDVLMKSAFQLFSAWYPLKRHTYLSKPSAECFLENSKNFLFHLHNIHVFVQFQESCRLVSSHLS